MPCNLPRFAREWEALGQTDSVIAIYERFVKARLPLIP